MASSLTFLIALLFCWTPSGGLSFAHALFSTRMVSFTIIVIGNGGELLLCFYFERGAMGWGGGEENDEYYILAIQDCITDLARCLSLEAGL